MRSGTSLTKDIVKLVMRLLKPVVAEGYLSCCRESPLHSPETQVQHHPPRTQRQEMSDKYGRY